VVEVRSRRSGRFGAQEERLDEAKVRRLYRAMNTLRAAGWATGGSAHRGGTGWRVDLVAIDAGSGAVRHLKGLIPR
jgi:Holliday junction resolvase-like predicted endonuclease